MRCAAASCLLLLLACTSPGNDNVESAESADASAGAAIAASVPDTEIFLADILWQDDEPQIGTPVNVTRRPGYDNQPVFSADGESLFFTSIRDGTQSDIYRFVLGERRDEVLKSTPESEYSPALRPGGGGLSAVVVEADGTQRIWGALDTQDPARPLLPDLAGVGYYAWLDDTRVAAFIVDEPPRLVLARVPAGAVTEVPGTPGRCLQKIPGEQALAFVDLGLDPPRMLRLDLETGGLAELIITPEGSQDFAWLPGGGVFMARERVLFFWSGAPTDDWVQVADLGDFVTGAITRLAVAPGRNKLAMVIARPEQP